MALNDQDESIARMTMPSPGFPLPTSKDVARVLFHESLGHYGLRGVFGKELGTILDKIAVVRRGEVRKKAEPPPSRPPRRCWPSGRRTRRSWAG